ncbi:hypothetical protein [Paraburkholderia sp. J41]|uniref:hypothetical protein n=1 Tax=Paraburkholderia sp. J41 TaxID=2805433 RepID=UPI002AC36A50|nr:hypothetical protein [Paraburkholderia sp. J41]
MFPRLRFEASRRAAGIYLNLEAVIMWFVGAGLILSLVACVANFSHLLHHVGKDSAAMFFATFLVMWAFLIIGYIMQLARRAKTGAVLLTLGSLLLVGGSFVLMPFGPLVVLAAVAALVTIFGTLRIARRAA